MPRPSPCSGTARADSRAARTGVIQTNSRRAQARRAASSPARSRAASSRSPAASAARLGRDGRLRLRSIGWPRRCARSLRRESCARLTSNARSATPRHVRYRRVGTSCASGIPASTATTRAGGSSLGSAAIGTLSISVASASSRSPDRCRREQARRGDGSHHGVDDRQRVARVTVDQLLAGHQIERGDGERRPVGDQGPFADVLGDEPSLRRVDHRCLPGLRRFGRTSSHVEIESQNGPIRS